MRHKLGEASKRHAVRTSTEKVMTWAEFQAKQDAEITPKPKRTRTPKEKRVCVFDGYDEEGRAVFVSIRAEYAEGSP
jgi:hypothetical protein